MGEPFYISNFIEAIESIDGVTYVDLFSPSDNILQSGKLSNERDSSSIGINELIIEGQRTTNYYYAKN
jgi:hypothetical protein